jgi:hypothetical protein
MTQILKSKKEYQLLIIPLRIFYGMEIISKLTVQSIVLLNFHMYYF